MNRDQKAAVVDEIAGQIEAAQAIFAVDYRGLSVKDAAELRTRLVEAGAASLTLHPRSARQMYTGTADHSLTAELVDLVNVPVVASGDITSAARARSVLALTGCAAVMVAARTSSLRLSLTSARYSCRRCR